MNKSEQVSTIPEALQRAIAFHRKGDLENAESLYHLILKVEPNNADALHLSGVIAHQRGQDLEAVQWIERAIRMKPSEPLFHFNLGISYHTLNRIEEAITSYRNVLSLTPNHYETLSYLAKALQDQGRLEEAIAGYRLVLSYKPDDFEALYSLGNALKEGGGVEEAICCYRQALSYKPDYHPALINMGNAFMGQGKMDKATVCYRQVLSLNPDQPEALYNLGNALLDQGKIKEASTCYRRALVAKPDYHLAQINLGNALKEQGRLEEAITCYRTALSVNPDQYETWYNLGNTLKEHGDLEEAVMSFKQALVFRPDYHLIYYNLGSVSLAQGRVEEAIAFFRQTLSINPDFYQAHNSLLCALQYLPGIDTSTLKQAHEIFEKNYGSELTTCRPAHRNNRDPERPLRIGFVSGDLKRHPVSYFLIKLLENIDSAQMKITCYSNSDTEDDMTARIQSKARQWRKVVGWSDESLTQQIREDGIDVLFDLSGHTAGNRLLTFARKPAPIQISWIGYPTSSGIRSIDYLMLDEVCVPSGEESCYTEQIIRLPHGYLCYNPDPEAPEPGSLPAFERGFVTFGSFNNLTKVNGEVIGVWSEILKRLPRAKLVLKGTAMHDRASKSRYAGLFESNGIDPRRVDFMGPLAATHDHLAVYRGIDIVLDTFPYNGVTTTCEALWMGVPVVTFYGRTALGRQGATLNTRVGLQGLIAGTKDDYIAIAINLASDLNGLSELRNGLRGRLEKSSLGEGRGFAAGWMQAVRQAWRIWCEKRPEDFEIAHSLRAHEKG